MINIETLAKATYGAVTLLCLTGWVFYICTQGRVDDLESKNELLGREMSNLVQRVNYYHGTNWDRGSGR
jgi:hypothetical protein